MLFKCLPLHIFSNDYFYLKGTHKIFTESNVSQSHKLWVLSHSHIVIPVLIIAINDNVMQPLSAAKHQLGPTLQVASLLQLGNIQGSHTSQMRKFQGIWRVIKGSTAHFQVYFWKTLVTLLYVNKISSNFSHLIQIFLWLMQHSKEVSIIFLKNS